MPIMQLVVIAAVAVAALALGLVAWSFDLRDYMARYDAEWSHVTGLGRVASARRALLALRTPLGDVALERRRVRTIRSLMVVTILAFGLGIVAWGGLTTP